LRINSFTAGTRGKCFDDVNLEAPGFGENLERQSGSMAAQYRDDIARSNAPALLSIILLCLCCRAAYSLCERCNVYRERAFAPHFITIICISSRPYRTDAFPDFGKRCRHQRSVVRLHSARLQTPGTCSPNGSTKQHVPELDHQCRKPSGFCGCSLLRLSASSLSRCQCPVSTWAASKDSAETNRQLDRLSCFPYFHRRRGAAILTEVCKNALPVTLLMRSYERAPLSIHPRVSIQGSGLEILRETIAREGRRLGCVRC
jgi:hypothetical protein